MELRVKNMGMPVGVPENDVYFVCIGTDRSTGDSLGPMVGTRLSERGYKNVIGTLEYPCHAQNLHDLVSEIPRGKVVVAIDSTLGKMNEVGNVRARPGYVKPGAGVGRDLGRIGDYAITGCVNVGGFMEHFVLQNTRLHNTMIMAKAIIGLIDSHFRQNVEVLVAVSKEEGA